ncbi:MAG: insulinase family protein [bacterium]|nr:insulinase family protein [bacterium]
MNITRITQYQRLSWILLACLIPAAAMTDAGAAGVFPYETHTETLDNGLGVILIPMSSDGLVAYWSVVRTGSRDEFEVGYSGFAHFFEHMMFRGTENYPADAYNEWITKMGADANAYTTDDLTAYHLGIAAEDLEQVMELESDRFRNLAYPEESFKTEAGAVYGEYRKNRMNPFFRIFEAGQEAAFKKHTYGHTTMGYERDIKRMPEMYEYSKGFFSRYYRPDNVVLVIVGDIDPAPTLELIKKHYGDWEPGYVAPQITEEPEQTSERRIDVTYEGRTLPIVALAYKSDRYSPGDRTYVAGALLTELAFGETSDLHKKLVLDEQVVEFVSASMDRSRDPGLFSIFARVKDPEKIDYVIGEIEKTANAYRDNPPDAQRLADAKSRSKYGFLMGLDTPDRVAGQMARIVAITGGVAAVDEYYGTLDAVTAEDVQAAAQRYLENKRRTVAVLKGGS